MFIRERIKVLYTLKHLQLNVLSNTIANEVPRRLNGVYRLIHQRSCRCLSVTSGEATRISPIPV